MDVRKDTFHRELVNLLGDIAESHFIAFDLEFSGIPPRSDRGSGKPSLQEVYQELKAAVEKYQILQVGLTIVKENEDQGRYVALPYNFSISPVPTLRERYFRRDWSMNSGAVSFLLRNGFDFGAQFVEGVPYLSRKEEKQARNNMAAEAKRTEMVLKPEDQPLASHIRTAVARWQAQPRTEEDFLNIPDNDAGPDVPQFLNRYQLRLTHQIVEAEFPSFHTKGMGHFIQITNPSAEYQANMKLLEEQQRERDLARAVGFRWVFEGIMGKSIAGLPREWLLPAIPKDTPEGAGDAALKSLVERLDNQLRQRRKVLIGHNCFTDLIYVYRMIIGELPDNVQDFADQVHEMFPAIIDTKYLSDRHSEKYGRGTLEDVEKALRLDPHPAIDTLPGFERYLDGEYYHEAGFDSLATATVAIKLAARLHTIGTGRKENDQKYKNPTTEVTTASVPEFGVDEHYVTAAESATDSEASSQSRSLTSTLTTPIAVIKSLIFPNAQTKATSTDVEEDVPRTESHPIPQHQTEVEPVRTAFASTNIYDSLDECEADLTTSTSHEDDGADRTVASMLPKKRSRRAAKLVKEGKLMPRWHEERAFWQDHGNKVQVNACKEGVLLLTGSETSGASDDTGPRTTLEIGST